jgi:predicted secreted hydrolase
MSNFQRASHPKRWFLALLAVTVLLAACFAGWRFLLQKNGAHPSEAQTTLIGLPADKSGAAARDGFKKVTGPQPLVFPKDHGPHPDYQTEWWYYTGNLETSEGRHFGYQLTFFRRAMIPESAAAQRSSKWAADQLYMAHFTLTDVTDQKFHFQERFERGAMDLAGAAGSPGYQVWLRDWSVKQTASNTYHLSAHDNGFAVDLDLTDARGPVLQGDRGYSQKGPQPGNASLYYSQTHLLSQGKIQIADQTYAVQGLSWMDHEISTSALSEGQVGWDWFALQLDDGRALMVYIMRRADGSIDAFSSGTLVLANGETRHLAREDFSIQVQKTWKSPTSGAQYPAAWTVTVPSQKLELTVQPWISNQELNVSYTYWEGAVQVRGTSDGKAVTGNGYVELTGYLKSMQGQF